MRARNIEQALLEDAAMVDSYPGCAAETMRHASALIAQAREALAMVQERATSVTWEGPTRWQNCGLCEARWSTPNDNSAHATDCPTHKVRATLEKLDQEPTE